MKVYVLTCGEYSCYHIVGVLLDEEQAKIAAEVMSNSYNDVEVETHDTDELKFIKPGWKYWTIAFSERDHAIVDTFCDDYYLDALGKPRLCAINHRWYVDVYAEDEDHAIKNASDRLNKYLAEQNNL